MRLKFKSAIKSILMVALVVAMFSVCIASATNVPANSIVPGVSIFTKSAYTMTLADPGYPYFDKLNQADGALVNGAYQFTGDGSFAGVTSTLDMPLDRKALVLFNTVNNSVAPYVKTDSSEVQFTRYEKLNGWNRYSAVIDKGTTTIAIGTYEEGTQYFGNVAVIPFFKVTYHIESPVTGSDIETKVVEYLGDTSAIKPKSSTNINTIDGIPTSYTVDKTIMTESFSGYKFVGWSTKADAASRTVEETVTLNKADIDLYPIFVRSVPADYIKPGVNIFTKSAYTVQLFNTTYPFFNKYNQTDGAAVDGAYRFTGNGSYAGVMTAFDKPLDRKALVMFNTYKTTAPSVMLDNETIELPYFDNFNGWDRYRGVIDSDTSTMGIVTISNDGEYYGTVAVIPYYKATYHIENPATGEDVETREVEFLVDDLSTISVASPSSEREITGLPTSYTIDNTIIPESFSGYKFMGWSTEADAALRTVETTVNLNKADIDLYPVFVSSVPARYIKPGANIFTGNSYTVQLFHQDYPYFNKYNQTDGAAVEGSYKFTGNGSYAGVKATFDKPLDRKALVFLNTYKTTTPSIMLDNETFELSLYAEVNGWNRYRGVINGETSTMGIVTISNDGEYYGTVAVIPYYKATYHIENPVTGEDVETTEVEFLVDDISTIAVTSSTNPIIMTGLPTSYTIDDAKMTQSFEGYEFLGWSTEADAASRSVVATVDLNNADIELYPVWEEVEAPVEPEDPEEPEDTVFGRTGIQVSEEADNARDARILFGLKFSNFANAGIVLANSNNAIDAGDVDGANSFDIDSNKVYGTIKGGNETYTAEQFEGEFIWALVIKGFPSENYNKTFYVRPYVVDENGEYIYGDVTALKLADAIES